MTKAELLSKLDEKALRNIAKNENFTVPKTYGKQDLVKYLEGTLTFQKIKEYTCEIYEKETKREIIRETIKEKGIRIKAKETIEVKFNKLEVIRELTQEEKIDLSVLEDIAKNLGEPIPKGKGFSFYDKMSEKMLEYLNRIFVKKESDKSGLFLEYRTANFIKRSLNPEIERIKVRQKFPDIGEIDVVGFNSKDKLIVMAECKDRKVKKEDLDKWVINSRKLFQDYNCSLEHSYFVTSNKLTNENFERIEKSNDIDAKRGQLKVISGKLERLVQLFNDEKSVKESGKVYLSMYEVRQNQFTKIFPRK